MHPDQGAPQKLALIGVTGGQGLRNAGMSRRFRLALVELMHVMIIRFPRYRHKRHQTNPADDIPAGILEKGQLLDEVTAVGGRGELSFEEDRSLGPWRRRR